ncbi:hypothetical protein RF11_03055 [Thelohanellus kitauei]|uniref:Uncharacterized protein n=1 Tax=Thelohanellus kitauei TaxID=669202 RepID=A0A0C2ITT8_THEKT|nr:hypothetical protein RF11_03055 [Thelohanellus kitauei]
MRITIMLHLVMMSAVVFICQFISANGKNPSMFSLKKSFSFKLKVNENPINIDKDISSDSEDLDRKKSLFGFSVVVSDDNKFFIVSAPGFQFNDKTYGDVFKCSVSDLENSCVSLLTDDIRDQMIRKLAHYPLVYTSNLNDLETDQICD